MTINTARELAAELWNAVDGEGDIPMSLMRRTLDAYGIEFEPCADCGRVEGQHTAYCPVAPRCETCGVGPRCGCDDWEAGE